MIFDILPKWLWASYWDSNEWLPKDLMRRPFSSEKVGPSSSDPLILWRQNICMVAISHWVALSSLPLPLPLLPRLKLFMTHKTLQWLHPCQHFSISTLFWGFNKEIFSYTVAKSKEKSHFTTWSTTVKCWDRIVAWVKIQMRHGGWFFKHCASGLLFHVHIKDENRKNG